MQILYHNDINTKGVKKQFDKVVEFLSKADFKSADVKKMIPYNYYRAKLDDTNRLLFAYCKHEENRCIILLEVIMNHDYANSRFLRGASIDESKLLSLNSEKDLDTGEVNALTYVNKNTNKIQILDKFISFDDIQAKVYSLPLPLIIIGSAGSGKTALILEKLKLYTGKLMYVTLSSYLVENSNRLYYSNNYENENQELDFYSFNEYVQSIDFPTGKEMNQMAFEQWIWKHKQTYKIKDTYKLFEEFKGVLTGANTTMPYLDKATYMNLGVRQSVYMETEREAIYDLFTKYLAYLKEQNYYDINIAVFERLEKVAPIYDLIVIDEVQDITNIQLLFLIRSLKENGQFMLCGDSNQVVHPNFFSWTSLKSMFYKENISDNIFQILATNYRNTKEVTQLANQLLHIKNLRFGSIDKESTFLIQTNSTVKGDVQFLQDTNNIKQELNRKTGKSTKFAVLVMRNEDKQEVKKYFNTPLVFSVQEAKGLEYENIILFNIISGNEREFIEIASGLTPDDLKTELTFGRARDKSDKSADVYKFYINSLYVAITRAINNLFVIEKNYKHPILSLLGLTNFRQDVKVKEQTSTMEEWNKEARKLEMQGKVEQASAIKEQILKVQKTPWHTLTREDIKPLVEQATNPDHFNKKAKDSIFEYCAFYIRVDYIVDFKELGYKPNADYRSELKKAGLNVSKEYRNYDINFIKSNINRFGINYKTELGLTPLLLAAVSGNIKSLEYVLSNMPDLTAQDLLGRNAIQLSLVGLLYEPNYPIDTFERIYKLCSGSPLKLKIGKRLVKIEAHQAEYLMVNIFIANLLIDFCTTYRPYFYTKVDDFINAYKHIPISILPEYRRNRSYISSIMSKNEINKKDKLNNKYLFIRIDRGLYMLNPFVEIEYNGSWLKCYDLQGWEQMKNYKHRRHMGYSTVIASVLNQNPEFFS